MDDNRYSFSGSEKRQIEGQFPDTRGLMYKLDQNNGILTAEIYKEAIKITRKTFDRMFWYYAQYCDAQDAVKIYNRRPKFDEERNPINNKIHMPIIADIVEVATGYFAGKPFAYGYNSRDSASTPEEKDEQKNIDAVQNEVISEFMTRNTISDVDMETTRLCTICGAAGRLLYHDDTEQHLECIKCLPPWQIIPIGVDPVDPKYGIYTYATYDSEGKPSEVVEFYTPEFITVYEYTNGKLVEMATPKEHAYNGCPVSYVVRNDQMAGDADDVQSIIDAIDRTVSDWSNDLEGFSNAYLVYKNCKAAADLNKHAQHTGAINVTGDNADVDWLTKDIKYEGILAFLDLMQESAYKYSQTPDLANKDTFAGNSSGVAMKYKLFGINAKTDTFERKYRKAFQRLARLLSGCWNERNKNAEFDPTKFTIAMKRSFPLDLESEAQTQRSLQGLISTETRLEQLSFIENPKDEMAKMLEEKTLGDGGEWSFLDINEEEKAELLPHEGVGSEKNTVGGSSADTSPGRNKEEQRNATGSREALPGRDE